MAVGERCPAVNTRLVTDWISCDRRIAQDRSRVRGHRVSLWLPTKFVTSVRIRERSSTTPRWIGAPPSSIKHLFEGQQTPTAAATAQGGLGLLKRELPDIRALGSAVQRSDPDQHVEVAQDRTSS